MSLKGTILDATALIDFHWLDEWAWLEENYSPLYIAQEVLDSDRLELPTRQTARRVFTHLIHESEEVYASYLEFASQAPLLSTADRATIALARHQLLLCASDDGLVVETCQLYGIAYTRTLRLLSEMVKRQHKTVEKVIEMAETLIEDRGKRITSQVLENWKESLQQL